MQTPTTAPADFAQALARLYPSLLKRAARLTHSSSEAQDLVHDTLERGLRRQESFRSGGEPDRWLGTIMRRAFIDRCRWARRWAFDAEAVETLLTPEPEEEAWWEGLDAADVRAAAAALRPPFRDVYCLFAFDHGAARHPGAHRGDAATPRAAQAAGRAGDPPPRAPGRTTRGLTVTPSARPAPPCTRRTRRCSPS
jgi:RNA polymerase sigma-70 factor (ECF subfamily)